MAGDVSPPADAGPFYNRLFATDVNNDGRVQPIDALLIINELRRRDATGTSMALDPDAANTDRVFFDVVPDDELTPLDALNVINELRRPEIAEVDSMGRRLTGPIDPQALRTPLRIDRDAPDDYLTTESGLQYRIIRDSPLDCPPPGSQVQVDYVGYLDDGTIFDSSYRRNQLSVFGLNQVIAGFAEGIEQTPVAGMVQIRIPPELGYGESGTANIPPNATLNFVVELYAFG